MPKRFNTEMPVAPYDGAMLDAHSLSAVADLLVILLSADSATYSLYTPKNNAWCHCLKIFTNQD